MASAIETVVNRIWTSREASAGLADLCALGGRFCGTDSETRARAYLRERLAAAAGGPVTAQRLDQPAFPAADVENRSR